MSLPFICADTEDDSRELMEAGRSGFDKRVTQIAALTASGVSFHNRGSVSQFLKWVTSRPEPWIYFHNLQYDLGNLFPDELDSLDITMVGGRLIKARWRNKTFVDSFNIWPMSAKKIGDTFGLAKLAMDIHSKEYVLRDVEIIRRAMTFAWKLALNEGLEKLPTTLGGLCVALWKEWGGENWFCADELARLALYGGRVELFRTHNVGRTVYTDINSLYPHCMTQAYPQSMEPLTGLDGFGIAEVDLEIPADSFIAPLPWRCPEGRIYYPTGKAYGTWTLAEIRNAVGMGAKVLQVYQSLGSKHGAYYYRDFVQRCYGLRQKAKTESESLFYKLLMNNLYGRLAVGGSITRSVRVTEENQFNGVPYGSKVLLETKIPLSPFTNYLHAAHVTSYGRIGLCEHLRKIPPEKLIYCDTDSTFFEGTEKTIPFPVSAKLGEMKLEGVIDGGCMTYAPKSYRLGKEWKAKGVPRKLAEEFLSTGTASYDLPFKMREAIAFFDRDNARRLSVWRKVEKVFRTEYDKKKMRKGRFFPLTMKAVFDLISQANGTKPGAKQTTNRKKKQYGKAEETV